MILAVDPLLEPSNGPNYFPFDDEVVYKMNLDNNRDGVDDIVWEFRFTTEVRLPGVFTGFVGAGQGIPAPANAPTYVDGNPTAGNPLIPPAITALDGCLLYTSDAADDLLCVDLGGRRIIKK